MHMAGKQVVTRIRAICWSNNCVDKCVKELLVVSPEHVMRAMGMEVVSNANEALYEVCKEYCSSDSCEELMIKARSVLSRAGFEALLAILGIHS